MKRSIALSAALLVMLGTPALARAQNPQGVAELAWGACSADGGASNVAFPCGAGDGTSKATLVLSFSNGPHQPDLVAMDGNIRLATAGVLPDFFKFATPFRPDYCNPGVTMSAERPASCPTAATPCGDGLCQAAFQLVTSEDGGFSANLARLDFGVWRTTPADVAANTHYFVCKFDFYADAATESGGSCAGCSEQAGFVLNRFALLAPPAGLDYEIGLVYDCATWNGAGGTICSATPVKTRTWGALKALYR